MLLQDKNGNGTAGLISDAVIRSLGVSLMTGDIPGIALLMGSADCAAHVLQMAKIYRDRGMIVLLWGAGAQAAPEERLFDTNRVFSLGCRQADGKYGFAVLARFAEIFCGAAPDDHAALTEALRTKLPAVLNAFGTMDEGGAAVLTEAEALGIPVVVEAQITTSPEDMAERSMEARGMKIKPQKPALPVAYDTAFEGERVRDDVCGAEFPTACELVRMAEPDRIKDHEIALIGRDIPVTGAQPVIMHLSVLVEVGGKRMQRDFESVIERRIHNWLCYLEGVEHRGQRNQVDLRISRTSLKAGLNLRTIGELLYYAIRTEYEPVADKCRITLITDAEASDYFVEEVALPRYQARDERLKSLTDESVDTFYTCTMCQSIAPRHCCVVTPQRSGMCGAVTWPDAKATYELSATGPNRPVKKGEASDQRLGSFENVNRAVAEATAGAVEHVSLYSIMENPMTGCGRLECICAVEAFSGGVVIADRDDPGMTPTGMTFGDMAELVFGGGQNPGFLGVSRRDLSSEKFISAEGGLLRIVWMPKALKKAVAVRINQTAKKIYGIENFCGMICDESITTDGEALLAFLTEKGHPVLTMEPIL